MHEMRAHVSPCPNVRAKTFGQSYGHKHLRQVSIEYIVHLYPRNEVTEGEVVLESDCPSVCPSVCRHNDVLATPPTQLREFQRKLLAIILIHCKCASAI